MSSISKAAVSAPERSEGAVISFGTMLKHRFTIIAGLDAKRKLAYNT